MLYSSGAALYGERLAVALGFFTLFFAVATFATCRSCLSFLKRIGIKNPMDTNWYRPVYKFHGYYWWGFLFGLLLHLTTAMMHTAIPTPGDPDAPMHWTILGLGLGSLVTVGGVLSSCRSMVSLVTPFMENGPLNNHKYLSFYQFHSLYWGILILAIAGHLTAAYSHIGLWPG